MIKRCDYCGWNNDANASTCVKCRRSLQNIAPYTPQHTPLLTPPPYRGNDDPLPNPTVIGPSGAASLPKATVIGEAGMVSRQPVESPPTRIMPDSPSAAGEKGDQRGLSLSDFTTTCEHCHEEIAASYAFCPHCGKKVELKTVIPKRRRKKKEPEAVKPKCTLTLVPEEDEETEAKVLSYEGDTVMLNRANTEPDNRTITSKEQAELRYENGVWSIVNRSEMLTTAIEANREMELQPGDIIVLGDRRFQFDLSQTVADTPQ